MSYPARLLPAGAGRRGDLLPAPSPDKISQSVARACASDTATGAAAAAKAPGSLLPLRAFPCSRANSPACGPGLSTRSPAGASGRCDFPNRCGGTGCASPSADTLTSSAMTADPRRADPGNPLAGAAFSPRCLPNWPVALRGGGHIAEAA